MTTVQKTIRVGILDDHLGLMQALAGWKPEHIECARLTARGCSVKETANAMHKSEDSVRGYRKLIYKKTGCGKATELAIWANDKNLFQEDNNH